MSAVVGYAGGRTPSQADGKVCYYSGPRGSGESALCGKSAAAAAFCGDMGTGRGNKLLLSTAAPANRVSLLCCWWWSGDYERQPMLQQRCRSQDSRMRSQPSSSKGVQDSGPRGSGELACLWCPITRPAALRSLTRWRSNQQGVGSASAASWGQHGRLPSRTQHLVLHAIAPIVCRCSV